MSNKLVSEQNPAKEELLVKYICINNVNIKLAIMVFHRNINNYTTNVTVQLYLNKLNIHPLCVCKAEWSSKLYPGTLTCTVAHGHLESRHTVVCTWSLLPLGNF